MDVLLALLFLVLLIVGMVAWTGHATRQGSPPERLPSWYEVNGDSIAILTYSDAESANADANLAAAHGWTVQSVTTSDGHVNVGRTVTGAVLTGGVSLLLGGSRTKGSVTVTFVRPSATVSV